MISFLAAVLGGILIGQFVGSRQDAWGWGTGETLVVIVLTCFLWGNIVKLIFP